MLSYQWHAEQGIPVVFLHGLLGSQQDWQSVIQHLQNFPKIRPLTIDLPFHGHSEHITCADFTELRMQLHTTLEKVIGSHSFYLVGYSLGGRTALDYVLNIHNPNLLGTILEGANIGLASTTERQARWQNDCQWANRFRHEPIEKVLEDWYQQPVFVDLSDTERKCYIDSRKHNQGERIAQMLEATSLAKQPNYAEQLKQTDKNILFFIGDKDKKFRQMTEQHQLPVQIILKAGHNAHRGNTENFVEKLLAFIFTQQI
ncbi:hydrolase [Mannheimia varigena USDA-ARS-USMARC-1296]|uniref:Putative 2-succinyl-6-hydroxy-2,4-cyclohexadiene-1-carboxylate synthase n=1 Tax=Mannheimia varigena USDA-ARS-USMARC-1296 TaxID=1433287 RepID=W0QBY1_9PAST|nr:2-succinyl-6-hydroxy-2,4-cyclohexadiene-1-carboxylate synthase [Mannheimia varigena]AHG74718.1 hydrolase [Mannheimia varigena USDA-ARS-USMARC-1296]TLU74825.1 2-succinyl-6-hydroxy-2,4-cyclohexadiene-1-carboxylate synthase [Mannheimia varigena]